MLANTLYRVPRSNGLHLLQRRGPDGARELTSWRLRAGAGTTERYASADEETVVVLQEGRGTFDAGGQRWPVSRSNVFDERATAIYLPPGCALTAHAETPLEAVLNSAPAPTGGAPALVRPDDVRVNARGRGNYAREVHDIFVTDPHAARLMVGETFNPAGNW